MPGWVRNANRLLLGKGSTLALRFFAHLYSHPLRLGDG